MFGETPNTARGTRALPVHRFPRLRHNCFYAMSLLSIALASYFDFSKFKSKKSKKSVTNVQIDCHLGGLVGRECETDPGINNLIPIRVSRGFTLGIALVTFGKLSHFGGQT